MKKNIFLVSFLLILFLFLSCTDNSSNSGRITITNTSKTKISNVYIGDTFIAPYVEPGHSYDYYYYSDFEGKLNLYGIYSSTYEYFGDHFYNNDNTFKLSKYKSYINDIKLKLKTGYWVEIRADTADEYYILRANEATDEYGNVIKDYTIIHDVYTEYIVYSYKYKWVYKPKSGDSIAIDIRHDYIRCSAKKIGKDEYLSPKDWLE